MVEADVTDSVIGEGCVIKVSFLVRNFGEGRSNLGNGGSLYCVLDPYPLHLMLNFVYISCSKIIVIFECA